MTHQTRREIRAAREAAARADGTPDDADERASDDGVKKHRGLMIALIIVIVLLASVVWLGLRALSVKGDLEAAERALAAAQDGGDMAAELELMGRHAASAAGAASDPVWRIAEIVPVVGENLLGVRLAAETLDVLANDIGVPVLKMQADGQGNIVSRALPLLSSAQEEVSSLAERVSSVAASSTLVGPVRAGIEKVDGVLQTAAPVLEILPDLLGADGAREYLLVFQNNAESLALGGSAASQSLLSVDNGQLSIVQQASSSTFTEQEGNAVDVDVDNSALRLYGSYLIDRINTSTSRPDFPTAAKILRAWWERDLGVEGIDGVVSVDPLALARVLKATGPIQVGDVELTRENAVKVLLSDVYTWWDPTASREEALASDAFFAVVATTVFEKVASGSFNLRDMAWAIEESVEAGSIMAWTDDADLAPALEGQRIAGQLPTDNDDATVVGVYYRNASASKIDYYMKSALELGSTCEGGTGTFTATSTMTLDISQAEADALPPYVMSKLSGSEAFRTEIFVYGPPGTTITDTKIDDGQAELLRTDIDDLGRPVAWFAVTLAPTKSATVTATFSGSGDFAPLEARVTPMINATEVAVSDGCS